VHDHDRRAELGAQRRRLRVPVQLEGRGRRNAAGGSPDTAPSGTDSVANRPAGTPAATSSARSSGAAESTTLGSSSAVSQRASGSYELGGNGPLGHSAGHHAADQDHRHGLDGGKR
jgi:hypothetical protein